MPHCFLEMASVTTRSPRGSIRPWTHRTGIFPRDPKTVWVFPMDGTSVWPRTSPGGKPAAYVTRSAGGSWKRLDAGLPRSQGWFTVKRQVMSGG